MERIGDGFGGSIIQFVALVWVKIVNPISKIGNRMEDEVYYLHGDHLGSTSLTTDENGVVVSEARTILRIAPPLRAGALDGRGDADGLWLYKST